MKRLTHAAAGAAVAGLAACSHASVPSATPAGLPTVTYSATPTGLPGVTHSAGLADCKQQYNTWKQGPGNGLVAAVSAVGSAGVAGDTQVLTAVLKKAESAVVRAARYPMPACADPKGYWLVLLMHVNAAAASTGSASSLKAAMRGVPTITHDLLAELKRIDR